MLTNKEDKEFTITEIEVWGVKFLVINKINLIIYRTEEKSQRDNRKKERERDTQTQKERSQQALFVVVITAIIFKHFTLSLL
jgi:hypothetical protein